jgi:uncharacterized protein (TIGR02453 family)
MASDHGCNRYQWLFPIGIGPQEEGDVSAATYFTRDLFRFLSELGANNDRAWFQENNERYKMQVRDPLLRFIADLGPGLHKINQCIVADPSPARGSMMRIYRDIRFSKDKSPYKTSAAAHFWHERGKEGATPAYYLRLEPHGSMIAAGIWHPESEALKNIRNAVAANPQRWKRVISSTQLGSKCKLGGESLQRPPRGYDPNHPLIRDIKRKDFTVGMSLADGDVLQRDFLEFTLATFRKMAPLVEFLSEAVGLS